jgi:competence protein ComEA
VAEHNSGLASSSTQRVIAIAILALLAGLLVVGAAVLLARGNRNAPIQVLSAIHDAAGGGSTGLPGASPVSNLDSARSMIPTRPLLGQADVELQVYVSGAVINPGVYTLRAGARLVDALAAAGGATAEADLAAVNLARRVRDEEHYHVPRVGEAPPAGSGGEDEAGGAPALAGNRPINLNTASVDLLVTLPGIGPSKAKAIVDYRRRNGPFKSVDEIINVPGIGPSTYELIRPLVTVSGTP